MGCFIFCFLRRRLRWLWLHYYCPFALQQQDRIRFVVNAEGGGSSSLSLFTGSFSSAATMPCMKNWSVLKLSPSSSSSVPSVLFLLSFFRRTIERRAGKTWWRRWRTMRRVHSTQLAEERPTHRRNGECQNIIRRGMCSLGKGTKEKGSGSEINSYVPLLTLNGVELMRSLRKLKHITAKMLLLLKSCCCCCELRMKYSNSLSRIFARQHHHST